MMSIWIMLSVACILLVSGGVVALVRSCPRPARPLAEKPVGTEVPPLAVGEVLPLAPGPLPLPPAEVNWDPELRRITEDLNGDGTATRSRFEPR